MRKLLFVLGSAALASLAAAQIRGIDLLRSYAKTLNEAQALRVTYRVTPLGEAGSTYTVEFAKPSRARVDTPRRLVVSDGTEIVTYDKDQDTFTRRRADASALATVLMEDPATALWTGFFITEPFATTVNPVWTGEKARKGTTLDAIRFSSGINEGNTTVVYLDRNSKMLRQAELDVAAPGLSRQTLILDTSAVELEPQLKDDRFAWKAPEGATEITAQDLAGEKWYTDLDEALLVAKKTKRLVLVDFYAEWCGPCKALEKDVYAKPAFKEMSKDYVFCKIDTDRQVELSQQHNIESLPTLKFMRPDSTVLLEEVGGQTLDQFIKLMNKAKSLDKEPSRR